MNQLEGLNNELIKHAFSTIYYNVFNFSQRITNIQLNEIVNKENKEMIERYTKPINELEENTDLFSQLNIYINTYKQYKPMISSIIKKICCPATKRKSYKWP